MRTILVLCALGVITVTAAPKNPQRIVGGTVTTISQYPEITSLLYLYGGISYSQACGGTILNQRSILSAAHCFVGDLISHWRIRVGSSYANSGGIVHGVSDIIIHYQYNTLTNDNDIAILRTVYNIAWNTFAQPASIPTSTYVLNDTVAVVAAGWGATSYGGPASEQLRRVEVQTINTLTCRNRYATISYTITDNMLCSGILDVGGRDQCQGDSGGPLYHNGVVVGISSWGNGCGLAYFPGVNTRVSRYTTWIQSYA